MKKLLVILMILCSVKYVNAGNYTFEIDKDFSIESTAKSCGSLYHLLTDVQEKETCDGFTFKSISYFFESFVIYSFGHEFLGHGSAIRDLGIPADYHLMHTNHKQVESSKDLYIVSLGPLFSEELYRQEIKYQTCNEFDYKSSIMVFIHKFATAYRLTRDNNDYSIYLNRAKKNLPDMTISRKKMKNMVMLSSFDPMFFLNSYELGKDLFLNGRVVRSKRKFTSGINFVLRPNSVTNEFFVSKKFEIFYSRVGYEFGTTSGLNIEVSDIKLSKNIKLGLQTGYVKRCETQYSMSIHYKEYFVRLKKNNVDRFGIPKVQIFIGIKL